MRILVFRPSADAERTAEVLRARGHEPIVAPLFTVSRLPEPHPQGPFDAIVLTSFNGAAALADLPADWRELPVFAVGERTAEGAREAGARDVRIATGNRHALVTLITETFKAPARLLLIAARDRHEDVEARLKDAGYEPVTWVGYVAEAAKTLPETAATALREGRADAALHYSARGAATFLTLAKATSLSQQALEPTQICISAAAAEPLIAAGAGTVLVAEYPEEQGLLAVLDQLTARNRGSADDKEKPGAQLSPGTAKDPMADSSDAGKPKGGSKRTPPTIDLTAQEQPSPKQGGSAAGTSASKSSTASPADATKAVAPDDKAKKSAVASLANDAGPKAIDDPVAGKDAGVKEAVAREASAKADSQSAAPKDAPAANASGSPEAVLPTEALPREYQPGNRVGSDPAPGSAATTAATGAKPRSLVSLLLAGVAGGVVGAAIVVLLQGRMGGSNDTELGDLRTQLSALQKAMTTTDTKATAAQQAAAKAEAEAKSVGGRIGELANAQGPEAKALAEAAARAAQAEAAAKAQSQRLDEALSRLGNVETQAKANAGASPEALAAARIVLSDRVRGAIASGRPFAGEVAALARGPSKSDLAPLQTVAEKGAPTREALLAQFRSHRALFTREVAPLSASWQDRLVAVLSRIVTVRTTDGTASTDPATLPLRLENAISANDFARAATLWGELPEPARRGSEAFGAALKQRAEADAAIGRVAQDAVAALGTGG